MGANMYDQAAEALFINTYVPINFGELYRIGAALKLAVDEAADRFTTLLLKFGEFRSPSQVDTKRYYDLTINRDDFLQAISLMVSNPDYLKDQANRALLQSLLNTVDYAALSQLKESADYLRMGLLTRAKMKAEGRLKDSWDKTDIANYDTLGTGRVFDDITPVAYMNLNELSTPYFNDLLRGFLGTEYVNGTRYIVNGNNMDDLMSVAAAKFNDLINTPQGQMYYLEYLELTGGDLEAAKNQFINAVAQSLIDRTRRPEYTVDPAYLLSLKGSGGRGQQLSGPLPDLSTMLAATTLTNNLAAFGGLSPEERNSVLDGSADKSIYLKASLNMSNNLRNAYTQMVKSSNVSIASRKLLDAISLPLSQDVDSSLLKEGGGQDLGKDAKIVGTTADMTLGPDMTYGLIGYQGGALGYSIHHMKNASNDKQKDKWKRIATDMSIIQQAWYNNQFRDVIVKGDGKVLSDNNEVYHKRKVYIPVELLRALGFTSIKLGDFANLLGSKMVKLGDILDELEIKIQLNYEIDDDLNPLYNGEVIKGETTKQLARKLIDKSDLYLEFDATYPLLIGSNEATITRNANYEHNIRRLGTEAKYSQSEYSANRYLYGE